MAQDFSSRPLPETVILFLSFLAPVVDVLATFLGEVEFGEGLSIGVFVLGLLHLKLVVKHHQESTHYFCE